MGRYEVGHTRTFLVLWLVVDGIVFIVVVIVLLVACCRCSGSLLRLAACGRDEEHADDDEKEQQLNLSHRAPAAHRKPHGVDTRVLDQERTRSNSLPRAAPPPLRCSAHNAMHTKPRFS